jgi:adenylosuccinate synthase
MLQDIGVHFQEIGREFGTTTGRRRRCGWLDLVVMKHSCQINGYDTLNLTKLDILDDLEEIKVAVKYLVDGKELLGFPGKRLFYYFWLCCELIWVNRSKSGNAEDGRGVICHLAWLEDVNLYSVVIRGVAI